MAMYPWSADDIKKKKKNYSTRYFNTREGRSGDVGWEQPGWENGMDDAKAPPCFFLLIFVFSCFFFLSLFFLLRFAHFSLLPFLLTVQ